MAIVVGSVAVEIVPSAAGFRRKLAAELRDLSVKVDLDVDVGQAIAEIAAIEKVAPEIDLPVDVQEASVAAEMAGLDALVEAAKPEIKIPVRLDTKKAFLEAGVLSGRIRGMVGVLLGFGPALIPVMAATTAAIGGLSAALFTAGAGVAAFGAFAIPLFAEVGEASEDMAKAQEKVNNALTDKQRETALARQKQLLDGMNPALRAAVESLNALKQTYKNLQTALAPAIFEVFNAGLAVANAALPLMAKVAAAVAPVLTEVANALAAAMRSPEMLEFTNFIIAQAGPAIRGFATIIGNLAQGFANLLMAFAPLIPRIMAGMIGLSEAFVRLADFDGFRRFLEYAIASLPVVGAFIGQLIGVAGALFRAFAPFGDALLTGLTAVFEAIKNLANFAPELTIALVMMAAAAILLTGPVQTIVLSLIAIGAAFKWVYDNSAPLRSLLDYLGTAFGELANEALPVLKEIFADVMEGIRGAIDDVGAAIEENRPQIDQIVDAFKGWMSFLISDVLPILGPILGGVFRVIGANIAMTITIIGLLVDAFHRNKAAVIDAVNTFRDRWNTMTSIVSTVVNAVVGFVTGLWSALTGAFTTGIGFLQGLWQGFWGSTFGQLVSAVIGLVVAVVRLGLTLVMTQFKLTVGIIAAVVRGGFNLVRSIISTVMNAVSAVVSAIWSRISGVVNIGINNILVAVGRARAVAGIIGGAFEAAFSAAASAVGKLISLAASIGGKVLSAVGNFGSMLFNAGSELIGGLIRGITSRIKDVTSAITNVTEKIKNFLPGSPVKEGPLRVLNDGYAGGQIVKMLAAGIEGESATLTGALSSLTGPIGAQISVAGADRLAVAGATATTPVGGNTYNIYPRRAEFNERNLSDHLYAIELRERVSRPR